jgi:hypothetical protein
VERGVVRAELARALERRDGRAVVRFRETHGERLATRLSAGSSSAAVRHCVERFIATAGCMQRDAVVVARERVLADPALIASSNSVSARPVFPFSMSSVPSFMCGATRRSSDEWPARSS